MEPIALERFKKHVNEISVGDDITRVLKIVGVPDKDETTNKSQRIRTFIYCVTRLQADSFNARDKIVLIAFARDAKVIRIHSNVDGIPSKNWFTSSGPS